MHTDTPAEPLATDRGLRRLTAVLLGLWLVVTIGARLLTPIVASIVERVEVATGMDVSGSSAR